MVFKILSLDGGGMRGILSARLLLEVEQQIREEKGQTLHEYFDLIAGTSTGSILAAAIALGKGAEEAIEIYQNRGNDIFLPKIRQQRQSKWRALRRFFSPFALYPHAVGESQGLANVLKEELCIQDENGVARCPNINELHHQLNRPILLILAYDTLSRNTSFFASNNPADNPRWYDSLPLWQLCTASSSAPTFFPPYELPYYSEGDALPHIDGGVSANNPELAAIAHALLDPDVTLKDITLLSVGTGKTTKVHSYSDVKQWGQIEWLKNLPDIFLNPGAEISEAMSRQLLFSQGAKTEYLRLNFDLNTPFETTERKPRRLRKPSKNPYNPLIEKYTEKPGQPGQRVKISEEIDDPQTAKDLLSAAEAYLEKGEVIYINHWIPVKSAIREFIQQSS